VPTSGAENHFKAVTPQLQGRFPHLLDGLERLIDYGQNVTCDIESDNNKSQQDYIPGL
jgi:hypothetical protein